MFKRDTAATPVPVKPPMVSGGAAMMLKSLGIDPSQMEALTEAFLKDVASMAKRVEELERGNAELRAMVAAQTVLLEKIVAEVLEKIVTQVCGDE